MAARVGDVAATFFGLAVLLCVVAFFFSTPRPPVGGGEVSVEVKELVEELRQLRDDVAQLNDTLHTQQPAPPASKSSTSSLPPRVGASPLPLAVSRDSPQHRNQSVLLGVITNPAHIEERDLVRRFYKERFPDEQGRVRVVFVVGRNYYLGNPPKPLTADKKAIISAVAKESQEKGDIVWVDGRENLPHVGKATEKSAAWWQAAPTLGSYGHYCKSDDDSLVHIGRLRRDLEDVGESVLYGYVAFRGWKPDYKFQACGIDTRPWAVEKALHGQDMNRDENCSDSVGPFPYAGGNLVCMGQVLARQLSGDPHFDGFVKQAHIRNDNGIKCHSPLECARQPFNVHMWHHEDAGISYNLFRSVVRGNLRDVKVVKIQPWVHIQHWLRDNITEPIPLVVIHNLKGIKQLRSVTQQWATHDDTWSYDAEKAKCHACSKKWGWKWSRTCCEGEGDYCEKPCDIDPNDIYTCCAKTFPQSVMDRMNDEEKQRAVRERELRRRREEAHKMARKST